MPWISTFCWFFSSSGKARGPASRVFFLKMSYIGEMTIVLAIIAEIYWCVNKEFGNYLLMGWSSNRIVNGLLKVTACIYRP